MSALPLPQNVKSRSIRPVRIAQCHLRICDPQAGGLLAGSSLRERAPWGGDEPVQPIRFTEQFRRLLTVARQMTETAEAEAILLLLEGPTEWSRLKGPAGKGKIVVAANTAEDLAGAKEAGLETVRLDMPDSPIYERLTQSVLEAVADDILTPGLERGRSVQRLRCRHDRFAERNQSG